MPQEGEERTILFNRHALLEQLCKIKMHLVLSFEQGFDKQKNFGTISIFLTLTLPQYVITMTGDKEKINKLVRFIVALETLLHSPSV